jgi:DNA-binding transcriptional MerR regulator
MSKSFSQDSSPHARAAARSQGAARPARTALPDRQFFKIGEAADLVGVKTHVLRYWESEFPGLRPMKTRGAHRMYRRADVELACVIRRLLHQEGYTIPGAKKRVRELLAEARVASRDSQVEAREAPSARAQVSAEAPRSQEPDVTNARESSELDAAGEASPSPRETLLPRDKSVGATAARELGLRAELIHLRGELAALLSSLDKPAPSAPQTEQPARARVTAVVAKTVLINQRTR